MKLPIRTLLAASLIAVAAPQVAFADQAETDMVMKAMVTAGVEAPMVNVAVENGVATLSGTVQDDIAKQRIVETVKATEGVTDVVDNIETSS